MRTCARELIMFTTVTLLFIGEILQFLSLGPYTSFYELKFYFNFDNFIQIIVIFLAAASLVVQNEEHLEKWISAFGIVFAYIGNKIQSNDLNTAPMLYYFDRYWFGLFALDFCFDRIRIPTWTMSTNSILTFGSKQCHVLQHYSSYF